MEKAMPQPDNDETRRFAVHAAHEGAHHDRRVEGRSFEDAALAFVENWHPAVDAEGEVSVIVLDCETGHRQCFRIDMETGEAGACD
jgi:hypothetical protein